MQTYLNDNIVFSNEDTLKDTLTKTVQLFAGSHRLKTELTKHKVNFVRVNKGAKVSYILRSKTIGRLIVVL